MTERDPDLQSFVDAAQAAFAACARHDGSRASIPRIFSALEEPAGRSDQAPSRLPVCELLDQVADPERFEQSALRRLASAFRTLEPQLAWTLRPAADDTASDNFRDGHANATIAGPGGLERRSDVRLGVSLLGSHVRYPDHRHPPEETYLVLTQGEFRQGEGDWFSPGIGGSFYNEPDIVHAMRSGPEPLFAFWALWARPHMQG